MSLFARLIEVTVSGLAAGAAGKVVERGLDVGVNKVKDLVARRNEGDEALETSAEEVLEDSKRKRI